MSINIHFQDSETSSKASVVEGNRYNHIPVKTSPLTEYINRTTFFINENFGSNMAVDASTGGGALLIHNGTDTTAWNATDISGDWDFQSDTYSYEGTYSIDATDTRNNDTAQITNDSPIELGNYSNLSGYVYITRWQQQNTEDIQVYFWDSNTSSIVGERVELSTYINIETIGQWQKFTIPLYDMNVIGESTDSLRITTVNVGGTSPNYYLDNIELEGTSGNGPQTYFLKPEPGEVWWVRKFGIFISREYSPVTTDLTVPNIPHKGFLGLSLVNGIVYQRVEDGKERRSFNFKNLYEVLLQPGTSIRDKGYDGTYTWLKLDVDIGNTPYRLTGNSEDYISFTLSENFSSMDRLLILSNVEEVR